MAGLRALGLPLQMASTSSYRQRQDQAAHWDVTAHSERLKSNEDESSTLMVDSDYVLDSCLERDFDNHGCSKTI